MPRPLTVDELADAMRASALPGTSDKVVHVTASVMLGYHHAMCKYANAASVSEVVSAASSVCAHVIANTAHQMVLAGCITPAQQRAAMLELMAMVAARVQQDSRNLDKHVSVELQQPDADYDFRQHLSGSAGGRDDH